MACLVVSFTQLGWMDGWILLKPKKIICLTYDATVELAKCVERSHFTQIKGSLICKCLVPKHKQLSFPSDTSPRGWPSIHHNWSANGLAENAVYRGEVGCWTVALGKEVKFTWFRSQDDLGRSSWVGKGVYLALLMLSSSGASLGLALGIMSLNYPGGKG